MLKKLFYGVAVLIIAAVAAFNVNLNSNGDGLSDISLANVEALADFELNGGTCLNYCFVDFNYDCHVYIYGIYCGSCVYFRG